MINAHAAGYNDFNVLQSRLTDGGYAISSGGCPGQSYTFTNTSGGPAQWTIKTLPLVSNTTVAQGL